MPVREVRFAGDPVTGDEIDALAARLNVRFPADYRAFLQAHNGGRPIPDSFPIPGLDNDGGSLMDEFFGVTGDQSLIERLAREFVGRLPDGLLPIGNDAGGNKICLGMHEADFGKVFFWDHDYEEEKPTWNNVYPLADTFTAFLDSFRERRR